MWGTSFSTNNIIIYEQNSIGYVLYTLEVSIWCLLTTNSYSKAVLKAVNLGYDTDTNVKK